MLSPHEGHIRTGVLFGTCAELPDSHPPTPGAEPLSVMQRTQDRLSSIARV
jgi:hypothetical protein